LFVTFIILLQLAGSSSLLTAQTGDYQTYNHEIQPLYSKDQVTTLYRQSYCPTELTLPHWRGNIDRGDSGSMSEVYLKAVKQRIMFFRSLAGVPAKIDFDANLNDYAAEAALIMSANNSLSHHPDSSWTHYSTDGDLAAQSSNLSLGDASTNTIDRFMADDGDHNKAVGHRRWILFPETKVMGLGIVDPPPINTTYSPAFALWISPNYPTLPTNEPPQEANSSYYPYPWPPAGPIPYSLIPKRWSFSLPRADFSEAVIEMSINNVSHSIVKEPVVNGFGDNTIAWSIATHPDFDLNSETIFNVRVRNVKLSLPIISNTKSNHNHVVDFSYQVVGFNPDITPSSELQIKHTIKYINSSGFTVAFMVADAYGCLPQREVPVNVLWSEPNKSSFKLLTTTKDKGQLFLQKGLNYILEISPDNNQLIPFQLYNLDQNFNDTPDSYHTMASESGIITESVPFSAIHPTFELLEDHLSETSVELTDQTFLPQDNQSLPNLIEDLPITHLEEDRLNSQYTINLWQQENWLKIAFSDDSDKPLGNDTLINLLYYVPNHKEYSKLLTIRSPRKTNDPAKINIKRILRSIKNKLGSRRHKVKNLFFKACVKGGKEKNCSTKMRFTFR
jgi:hypothetical protein